MGGRKDAGILVGKVISDSAAEKSGVKAGDMIVSVDGKAISDARELGEAIEDSEGKTIDLEIIRDKRPMHIKVTLPAIEDEDTPRGPRASMMRMHMAPMPPLPPAAPAAIAPPAPPVPPAPPALMRTLASVFV